MIKIGEFSKLAKTTIRTLRYYDEIGLFKPVFIDDNGYRYYEINQLTDLLTIIKYRNLGLSIENILDIFNGKDKISILNNHLNELNNNSKVLNNQIVSLKEIIKGEEMKYNCLIKEIKENIVYYRRGTIGSIDDLFSFILEAGELCSKLNPNLKCKDYCYVTYTATEYKEKDVEVEYVEAVEKEGISGNDILFRVDPKIKALTVENKGSYSNLRNAYAFALNEIKEKNYKIVGPIREVYIHGCWDKDNEDDYLTEIQIPIE